MEKKEVAHRVAKTQTPGGLRMLELASRKYADQSQEAVTGALEVRYTEDRRLCN